MKKSSKTKSELLSEISLLKKKNRELEKSIANRKSTDKELHESEERYKSLANNVNFGINLIDRDFNIITTNVVSGKQFNKSPDELVGKRCFEEFEKRRTVCKHCPGVQAMTTGQAHQADTEGVRDNGSRFLARIHAFPLFYPDGTIKGFNEVVEDITELKQLEDKLRAQEEKYRTLFNNAQVALFRTKIYDGKLLAINKRYAEMAGYSNVEDCLAKFNAAGSWANADERKTLLRVLQEKGSVNDYNAEIIREDGTNIWISFSATIFPETGVIEGSIVDITARKHAEEEIATNKEQLSNALEMVHLGHWEYDIADDIFTFNDQFYKMFRTTVEQAGGYKMHSSEYARRFVHPDEMDIVGEEIRKAIETTDPHFTRQIEHRMLYADGTVGYITVRFFIVKDSHGRTIKIYGVNQDVTERKKAEEKLKKSQELLLVITENMSDMIRVTDLQGNNLYVSPSHFKGLGYKVEERIGRSAFDIVHPDDMGMIINKFSAGRISRQPVRVEYRVRHADGHYVWLETVADVLRDAQGEAISVVMSSRDISERRLAEKEKRSLEERLSRAEKMEALGALAGGVAHDLNNVLGVLSGYSELLLMEIPEGQRLRNHAEKIFQSTEKGSAIIQDLLTLARRGVTAAEVINLNSVVMKFLKTPVFENIKDYHSLVTFKDECEDELLNIKASPVHLEKTLMNLVSNAAEAISGKGEVTIRTENRYLDKPVRGYDEIKEGDYIILAVSDTGMGIPAEHREKIFEPFYTKKIMGRSGTGLGLAIVWGTVKDHDGYIDVQTEVGAGTTFTLYFPVTREELIAPQQKVPMEQYRGKGESVLVVDDIAEQRDVASGLLTKLGYKVHFVSSGEAAIEYLRGNKADILVLDMIMLPGIDGLETYQRVLEFNPKQKAILVSGFSETDRVRKAQQLGAGSYVKKPYVMEKIGLAIRDELNR